MSKHEEVKNNLLKRCGSWIDEDTVIIIFREMALAVEEAYKQGALDMQSKYSYPANPQPGYLQGFTGETFSRDKPVPDIQLTTVASLYAKEQGFKP